MPVLTRDSIIGIDDRTPVKFLTPGWGEGSFVYLRVISGGDRETLEKNMYGRSKKNEFDNTNLRAKIASMAIGDEKGNRIFNDSKEDYAILSGKNAIILDKIINEFRKINYIGVDAEEEMEKNSETDQKGGSTSD